MTSPTITFLMTYIIGGEYHYINEYDPLSGYTFHLLEFNDFGLPAVSRITQKGVFQDGDTNIDFRIAPRKFSIRGMVEANNSYEHIKVRDMLQKMFKVNNTAGTLRIRSREQLEEEPFTTTTIYREIDCFVDGGLNISSDTSSGYDVFYEVSFYATNPFWRDPYEENLVVSNTPTGDATDVPLTVPRTYGSPRIDNTTNVVYEGTFKTYPEFIITSGSAGIVGLIISNLTQGTSILIPTIQANTTLRINLQYGYKTVVDQNGTNQITLISPSSNLTTFAIVPGVGMASATNVIQVAATSSGIDSNVVMTYYTQYTAV